MSTIERGAAALTGMILLTAASGWENLALPGLWLVISYAAIRDAETQTIENRLSLLSVAGLLLVMIDAAPQHAFVAVTSAAAALLIALGMWMAGALGGGDVKLLPVVAAAVTLGFDGLYAWPAFLLSVAAVMGTWTVATVWIEGWNQRSLVRVPVAPALFGGLVVAGVAS